MRGFAPHRFEGFPGPPGAGQTSKTHSEKSGQTAFRYPVLVLVVRVWLCPACPDSEPGTVDTEGQKVGNDSDIAGKYGKYPSCI